MLEPSNRSRASRRRRMAARPPQPRGQQPIPLRRPNPAADVVSGRDQAGRDQAGRPTPPPSPNASQNYRPDLPVPRTDRLAQSDWAPRRSDRGAGDGRFNLKQVLFGNGAGAANGAAARGYGKGKMVPPRPQSAAPEGLTTGRPGSLSPRDASGRRQGTVRLAFTQPQPVPLGDCSRYGAAMPAQPMRRLEGEGTRRERSRALKPAAGRSPRTRQAQRQVRRPSSPLLHVMRLLIVGVGIGAIAGTLLSVLNPALRHSAEASQANEQATDSETTQVGAPTGLRLTSEITPLSTTIASLASQFPMVSPGVFLMDLDTGAYVNYGGATVLPAASMIKVPVLVAFFQDVDAGKIHLDEILTMQQEDVAEGSGDMQFQAVGSRFSALETATQMIVISDNTATNMLIRKMGGAEALNRRFQSWGLPSTVIRNPLPDLEGTNTSTPTELVELMVRVSQGDLLSLRSRDRMLGIMQSTLTRTLLPSGLDENAVIAHKTGDIGTLVGDVGVIDAPNGKRYVMAAMVKRAHNDDRAQELIRQMSRAAYTYLNQPSNAPAPVAAPSPAEPVDPSPAD